jgi:hypothetical protein
VINKSQKVHFSHLRPTTSEKPQFRSRIRNLDKFGRELKPGDKVTIQAEVVALYPTEPIINLIARLCEPRATAHDPESRSTNSD